MRPADVTPKCDEIYRQNDNLAIFLTGGEKIILTINISKRPQSRAREPAPSGQPAPAPGSFLWKTICAFGYEVV